VTEKHSFLTDKCFPSGSADSYVALAGQYKEPHHTGDIRIKRLSGSTTAKAALLSGHEVLDGSRVPAQCFQPEAETDFLCSHKHHRVLGVTRSQATNADLSP